MILQISFADDTSPWLLIGLAGLTILYVVLRPMLKRRDPLKKQSSLPLAEQRSVERDMSNLVLELSEMARQITAQLDTRAQKLELLIKEADEKIAALREAGKQNGRPADSSHPSPSPAPDDQPDPRHQQIYALADQGRSTHQIAQELGRPSGEIELILALRR